MTVTNMTTENRRKLYAQLYRETLRGLTPNVPGNRYSSQQQAYAKGRAWKHMKEMGL